jgi:trehalose/maltose transport system substrate-binding protein
MERDAGKAIPCVVEEHRILGPLRQVSPNYGEEETRNIWQAGNAAFMRNWTYAYSLGQQSVIAVKFDVTVLPKGAADGNNAACLGGWQLMVSAYSKAPDAAVDLVRYLASSDIQKKPAVTISLLPTLPALY